MKTILLGAVTLGLIAAAANAQTNQVPLVQPPPETRDQSHVIVTTRPQPTRLQRIFGPNATTGGALPALRRRELFKRTPMPPGESFDNVAHNPSTGRPEGIILFSIKF